MKTSIAARERLIPYRAKVARSRRKIRAHIARLTAGTRPEIEDFQLMLRDSAESSSIYQAGRFWADLNDQLTDLIWAGGLDDLRNGLFNRVFAGPDPLSRQVYRALLLLYVDRIRTIDELDFLASHDDPIDGGTDDQEVVYQRRVSLDFLQSVEEAYRLREAWRASGRTGDPQVIAELGAGYGRLAYVCRKMMPDCTYVILDLPQALACASSWLGRVLPGEPVPYKEGRLASLDRQRLTTRPVWLLSTAAIERIPGDTVDTFVNIYSFAEMPSRAVDNYFAHVGRITNGVFFTKQRKCEQNTRDGISMEESDYPISPTWAELFRRRATLYEDFFEAAYDLRPV